jgi:hypothetical protein
MPLVLFRTYESRKQPLAPLTIFYRRILKNILIATGILAFCLLVGIFGYHYIADAAWIDAIHNASMILSGMGPVIDIKSVSGKLFSSAYALFSGVTFITNIGFILTPVVHRLLHKLHVEDGNSKS